MKTIAKDGLNVVFITAALLLILAGCGFTTQDGKSANNGGDGTSGSGNGDTPKADDGTPVPNTDDNFDFNGPGDPVLPVNEPDPDSVPDPGPNPDMAPPEFSGLEIAYFSGTGPVVLTWSDASDNVTPVTNLRYYIFMSTTPGGEDFSDPVFLTIPGATSTLVTGLASGTEYYFVVRARDEAGYVDNNTVEKAVATVSWEDPTGSVTPVNKDLIQSADEPSLAFDGDDVYVAWTGKGSASGNNQTHVMRWMGGTSFESVGPAEGINVDMDKWSTEATMAFKGNTPYAAWSEMKNAGGEDTDVVQGDVYVKRFVSDAWTLIGGSLTISAAGLLPIGTIGHSEARIPETPHIAFIQTAEGGADQLFVKRWNEKAADWDLLDGPNANGSLNKDTTMSSGLPILTYLGTTPYVTWVEDSDLYVDRWNGTDWNSVGGQLNTRKVHNHPWIASDGDSVYVSWVEEDAAGISRLHVAEWEGSAWQPLGGSLNIDPGKKANDARVAASGSVPYVAWLEKNDANQNLLHVRYWNGSRWVLAGQSLNVDATRAVSEPHIAANGNTPYATWAESDEVLGEAPVYIKAIP